MVSITTAEQIASFLFSVGGMCISKNAALTGDKAVLLIRILFGISSGIQIFAYLYIQHNIAKKNDQRKFKCKSPMPLQEEEIEMSVYEYDMAECSKALKGMVFQILITSFIHYKWKGIQPVLIQAIGIIKPLLFSGLVREYIYGQKMERPFEKNKIFGKAEEPIVEEIKSTKKKEE